MPQPPQPHQTQLHLGRKINYCPIPSCRKDQYLSWQAPRSIASAAHSGRPTQYVGILLIIVNDVLSCFAIFCSGVSLPADRYLPSGPNPSPTYGHFPSYALFQAVQILSAVTARSRFYRITISSFPCIFGSPSRFEPLAQAQVPRRSEGG
jgi:hypothetical protein